MSAGSREHFHLADAWAFVVRWRWTVLSAIGASVLVTAVSTLRRPPRFVATTTLLMQNDDRDGGALSELALIASPPSAEGEIAVLRSRSLLEEVASDARPDDLVTASSEGADALRRVRLGLVTEVRRDDLTAFGETVRGLTGSARPDHRLRARFVDLPAGSRPAASVHFDDAGRVRVRCDDTDVREPYRDGMAVPLAGGGLLVLQAEGDVAGHTYTVRRRTLDGVVAGLRSAVRARETARNSGVLELSVEAPDPALAADVANALAHNYIVKSIELGSRQATRTAEFVARELERVSQQLAEAEEDFVRVAAEHARAIDVTASASACIERLSEIEAERTHLRLTRMTLEQVDSDLSEGRMQSLAALDAQSLTGLSGEFVRAIGELEALVPQLDRSDTGGYQALLQGRVESLLRESADLDRRRTALGADLDALASGDARALERIAVSTMGADRYAEELAAVEAQLALLVPSVTEKHPERRAHEAAALELASRIHERAESLLASLDAERELVAADLSRARTRLEEWPGQERERIDGALDGLLRETSSTLSAQLDGLRRREADLDREIGALEGELAALPESQRRLAEPLRRRETLTKIVQILADSQQRAHLTQAATLPSAVVLDPALAPKSPSGPHLFLNLLAACIAGLVVGAGIAWVRQSIGEGLYTAADLEQETDLPVLACVPRARSAQTMLQAAAEIDGVGGEPYRSIGDGLRFLATPEDRLQVVALTSCLPGEGKTHTSTRLALAQASLGKRVLLVDGDLRRPRVAERLGLGATVGLAEVLSGEADWRAAVHHAALAGVDVMTSGRSVRSPATLLGGPRMESMLAEVREHYDLVLVDLPPVLPVTDVEAVAARLDGVLLVYRSGGTSRRALARGVARLQRAGARLRGAVLNGVAERQAYADGFTYGYAYEDGRTSSRRRAG